jgi:hypothetical protein
MKYSLENLTVSLTLNLASFLRSRGYTVLWQESGETEESELTPSLGTISFIPEIPANPSPFVRLKSESGDLSEIVVPALTLQIFDSPKRKRSLGIGHTEHFWEQEVRIDAFAGDETQHRQLAMLFHEWLQRAGQQELPVSDYSGNATTPTVLEPVRVLFSDVRREELQNENAAVRFYINAFFGIEFIE